MSQHTELIAMLREIENSWSQSDDVCKTAKEAADALQAMERVPMTGDQIISATSRIDTQEYGWVLKIVRATEAHHGITPPEKPL